MVVVFSGCIQHICFWQVMVSLCVKRYHATCHCLMSWQWECVSLSQRHRGVLTQHCQVLLWQGLMFSARALSTTYVPLRIKMLSSNCNTQETCHWTVADGISEKPADKSWERVGNRRIEQSLSEHCICHCQNFWDTVEKIWGRGLNIILCCQRVTVGLHHYGSNYWVGAVVINM